MNKVFKGLFLVGLLLATLPVFAVVKPANLFSEHVVLQRNKPIPVWGTAKPGEKVTVFFNSLKTAVKADKSGKWMVKLKALPAGGPFNMVIKGKKNSVFIQDIYIGEVWLCSGQSNMDMTVAKEDRYWCGVDNESEEVSEANYPKIRVFDVDFTPSNDIQKDVVGKWEICSPKTVGHFSAAAYFFAKNLYDKYGIPFGLITSAFGASTAESWIGEKHLQVHPNLKYLLDAYQAKWDKFTTDPSLDQHNPYVCYNGMIAPLFPYAIRGVLWYQGESNGPSAKEYREIMETLIGDWRDSFGQGDFPFIYVQLANYGKAMTKPVENGSMMMVREAQVQNLSVPNTAMVVAIENAGDQPTNVHPKNKQEIGYRLAVAAQVKAYGEDIEASGPMYDHYQIKGDSIQLFFKPNKEDFVAWCDKLTGFAIAGEDKVFQWAQAKFEGKTIVVWNPAVPKPLAVRYCWGTNPPASLANRDGLWAPHFRTDNW